jgi:hypothetical protein
MAEQRQLIQPFDAALVREDGGRRIISAGASSYGYEPQNERAIRSIFISRRISGGL